MNGAFAEMARAGLGQAPAGTAAAPPVPVPARLPLDVAALRRHPSQTSALEFEPGAIFTGPGFVTVGGWGSKRQIAIPVGRWVLVAERFEGLGYGLPHQAGPGEQLVRDGEGWWLRLQRLPLIPQSK